MPPATVMAADSVMPVVPLYAAIVVPDVMPVPEINAPTIGGVAGVAVSVRAVDEPDVLPTPEPCDVKIDALPEMTRALIGPLPRSATAFAAIGNVIVLCANAGSAVQHSNSRATNSFFIGYYRRPTSIFSIMPMNAVATRTKPYCPAGKSSTV